MLRPFSVRLLFPIALVVPTLVVSGEGGRIVSVSDDSGVDRAYAFDQDSSTVERFTGVAPSRGVEFLVRRAGYAPMIAAPANAAMGMIQFTVASAVARPK